MITRAIAIKNLSQYIGQDLYTMAEGYGISVNTNGKQNKGWKGQLLEKLAGLSNSSKQAPNGLGFELKSTAFHKKGGLWMAKETMAITMINPEQLCLTPFFESHCWEKLKSLVFCAVSWSGFFSTKTTLLKVVSFDFCADENIIKEIEADYEFIRSKCLSQGFSALTGKDGKWIQARTKGQKNTSTRAFYARKELVQTIFNFP